MNDVNNLILFLTRHLIIRWEAEPPTKDVSADVDAGTGDVGVGAAAAVAFGGDEGVGAVDRLHMHRLPDRSALCIDRRDGIKDLLRELFPLTC